MDQMERFRVGRMIRGSSSCGDPKLCLTALLHTSGAMHQTTGDGLAASAVSSDLPKARGSVCRQQPAG